MNLELLEYNKEKLEIINSGRTFTDLSMINPDLPPPRELIDRLMEATSKNFNHKYSVSRGIKKLREGFAIKYKRKFNVILDPEQQICTTFGTKDAIIQILKVFKASSSILIGSPTYPTYLYAAEYLDLNKHFFHIQHDELAMLDEIEGKVRHYGIKLLLLNFPYNPTGVSVSNDFIRNIYILADRYGFSIINDFIYGEMLFEREVQSSFLSQNYDSDVKAVEIYSLSKAYNIPGWRVGSVMGNTKIVKAVSEIKSRIDYGLFLPLQIACSNILAEEKDVVSVTVNAYQRRIKLMTSILEKHGWEFILPKAGACVWSKIPEKFVSSIEVANVLLKKGIFVSPGQVFGEQYERFIRFALVVSDEKIRDLDTCFTM